MCFLNLLKIMFYHSGGRPFSEEGTIAVNGCYILYTAIKREVKNLSNYAFIILFVVCFSFTLFNSIFASMQCCHVLVWHVWKGAFIQEVREANFFYFVFLFMLYQFIQPAVFDCDFLYLSYISSFSGSRAFVFFSSPIPKELINHIKKDTSVLPRIGALREVKYKQNSSHCFYI